MNKRHLLSWALLVAVTGFAIGASIFTRDWAACTEAKGGLGCREPRDRAVLAWGALAVNALTLVTNILDDPQ